MIKVKKSKKKSLKLRKQEKNDLEREYRSIERQNGIQRELALQEKTLGVLEKYWRQILKTRKIESFHKDIQATWKLFEYAIDQKNRLIKELQICAKEAEDQTLLNLSGFVYTIDTMINSFHENMEETNFAYEQEILLIKKQALNEKAILEESVENTETHLGILIWAMRDLNKDTMVNVMGMGIAELSEMNRELSLKYEKMQNSLMSLYSMLWDQYKMTLKKYSARTGEKRKSLDLLNKKDTAMVGIINKQECMIDDNEAIIRRLKRELKMQEDGTLTVEFFDDLKSKTCTGIIRKTKEKMADSADLDRKQFLELVLNSENAIKWLKDVVKKGEKILTAKKMCDVLTTSHEKTKKYDVDQWMFNSMRNNYSTAIQKEMVKWKDFQNLSTNIANANATKKSLEKEKKYLLKENAELCQQVKNWMESMKFPTKEQTVDKSGPPIVIVDACRQVKYLPN